MKVKVAVAQLCSTLCDPMDCSPPGSFVHGFSRQEYWSGFWFISPGDLPNVGIEPGSPTLQADSLPHEPAGKPNKKEAELGFGPRQLAPEALSLSTPHIEHRWVNTT